jgi:rubredoxin
MAELNFKCRKCKGIFDSEVGEITFPTEPGQRPKFENDIICPKCGAITIDDVLLTELGQTQLTAIDMDNW